jgi:NADH-quinone oxidoreductase subunit J
MNSLLVFYIISSIITASAIGVVTSRHVVHATFYLLISLFGVAGVYVVLLSEFLAIVQILLYGGAIIIVILFALMLTNISDFNLQIENKHWKFALLGSISFFITGTIAFFTTGGNSVTGIYGTNMRNIGIELFSYWGIPFEVVSVILLVALIGAIVVSNTESGK